jgi:hypothetical protein
MRPQHSFSPIRFSPILRQKGLAPRLLNLALLEPALFKSALFKSLSFERRLSTGNPWIQVSGFPSLGNHVAHTCTGCPCASPAHPPRPGFISKYRNHQAPLPSLSPSRKNHTSYRRRIESAVNSSLSVFMPQEE